MNDQNEIAEATKSGVLIVGHGTRDSVGRKEFLDTVAQVQSRMPDRIVQPSFLELAEPRIDEGVMQLAQRGVRQITVMPLLLFSAGHDKQDIPNAVRNAINEAQREFGHVSHCQTRHLGCHQKLLELSARRFLEATKSLPEEDVAPSRRTLLLMVGRGSRDEAARKEMIRFTSHRSRLTPVDQTIVCFFAMASPSFANALASIDENEADLIVVQPHLLFRGEIIQQIEQRVAVHAAGKRKADWRVAQRLGADSLLADAVAARIEQSRRQVAL